MTAQTKPQPTPLRLDPEFGGIARHLRRLAELNHHSVHKAGVRPLYEKSFDSRRLTRCVSADRHVSGSEPVLLGMDDRGHLPAPTELQKRERETDQDEGGDE